MERERCTAKSKRSGERCQNKAVPGGKTCRMHGSATKRAKAAGDRKVVDEQIRSQLARMDVAPVADPLTELAKIAGQVVAWKDAIADRVNDLTSLRYSTEGGEQLRAEVALFERAMDRCEKFLTAMARLNIDERLARISEQQADLIMRAVTGGIADLGLPQEQQVEASRHVARRLRSVASG